MPGRELSEAQKAALARGREKLKTSRERARKKGKKSKYDERGPNYVKKKKK